MPSPALLSVDLNALARNFHTLEAVTGAPVHPVVKADAYGLGAEACATRLMTAGSHALSGCRRYSLRQRLQERRTTSLADSWTPLRTTSMTCSACRSSPVLNTSVMHFSRVR